MLLYWCIFLQVMYSQLTLYSIEMASLEPGGGIGEWLVCWIWQSGVIWAGMQHPSPPSSVTLGSYFSSPQFPSLQNRAKTVPVIS